MPAGIGASGYLAWTLETVNGTYLPPSTAGTVFIPILEESLEYTEERYFSPQLRQQVIRSDVKQGPYHVEGTVKMEADPAFLPYILHCSRHTIAKSGAGPYVYAYTPSTAGATSTAASGNVQRTASIGIIRNGVGFGYGGCTLSGYTFSIEDGILMLSIDVVGLSETTPGALGTPTWGTPNLYGADSSSIFVDTSGTSPAFAAAATDFNGFSFNANHNAEAQNRIINSRAASYVKFGETEVSIETELDFIDKTEYNNFVATTAKAIQLRSLHPTPGTTLAAATDAVQITAYRAVYETYGVQLPGMGDLIMADVTARPIGISGGDAYKIEVKSAVNLT